jgi:membrane fusion protein (multidrug efflux system)
MSSTEAKLRQIPAEEQRPQLKLAEPPARQEAPLPEQVSATPRRKRFSVRKLGLGIGLLALLAGAGWYGYDWYTVGRFMVSTDDAYVRADMSALSAKVSGYVAELPVAENSIVKAGTVILKLDDGDFRLAVASAKDRIGLQNATINRVSEQAKAQDAEIQSADAKVAMAEADVTNAQATFDRQNALVKKAFASAQALDQARADRDRAVAAVASAKADLAAAQAQRDVLNAQTAEAKATLDELNTELAKTERDLSFTEIKAPFDGIVSNRAVEPGQYVQTGQRVMALVPAADAYVEANLKETQLADVKPGQKVKISVDAWDGASVEGTVESISPASGAEFSLLPPENATGNFTKITQRVPVRIRIPENAAAKLRAGLSVVVDIDTRGVGTQAAAALE